MFRSLSIFGTLYTLIIIGLVGLLGHKVYQYYQANDGNLMAFMEEPEKYRDFYVHNAVKNKDKNSQASADSNKIVHVDRLNVSPEGTTSENNTDKSVKPTSSNPSKNRTDNRNSKESADNGQAQAVAVDNPDRAPARPQTLSNEPVSLAFDYKNNGEYLVLAGSFALSSNALSRVQELQQAGFSNAQIIRFENAVVETVLAGRFSNKAEADKLVHALKQKGDIRAYVHRQIN